MSVLRHLRKWKSCKEFGFTAGMLKGTLIEGMMKKLKTLLIKVDAVIKGAGFIGLIQLVVQKMMMRPLGLLKFVAKSKRHKYTVDFVNEGSTKIVLPRVTYIDVVRGNDFAKLAKAFSGRVNSEPLLRTIVFKLYSDGFLSPSKSIVDIGAWICDNALVWAKFLDKEGVVFAIDPSSRNLNFGRKVAQHNNINNVKFVEAVCSDVAGISMRFSGFINHASFSAEGHGYDSGLTSSTIDVVVNNTPIGLIHLDVEGHEFNVLRGAIKTIQTDKPVVIFEQHLLEGNPSEIIDWLRNYNYRIAVINELLIVNYLDCRNFIAFPESFPFEDFMTCLSGWELNPSIMPASFGKALLEF